MSRYLAGASLLFKDIRQHHTFGSYVKDLNSQATKSSDLSLESEVFSPVLYLEKQDGSAVPTFSSITSDKAVFSTAGGYPAGVTVSEINGDQSSISDGGDASFVYLVGSKDVVKVTSAGKAGIVLNDATADPTSSDQGGDALIQFPKDGLDNPLQVVFGTGAGNTVIRAGDIDQKDLDVQVLPGDVVDTASYKGLKLNVVFADLNESDLNFFYKTIYDKDPIHYDLHTEELGYVQINRMRKFGFSAWS